MAKASSLLSFITLIILLGYMGGLISSTYLRMSKQVGVIQLVGPIYSFRDITDQISYADKNSKIKALVLYVNSPGGAAYACMEIRRYLENMSKPNIAVMEEVAASGAYYIASAADEIVAHANTITGALGVICVWQDYSKWLEDEGIKFWVWKTGEAKDLFEPWRSPTEEENKTIDQELNHTYEILISDIARGRHNLTIEDVRQAANGSVYSGLEALGLGLIDDIGDYSQAVKKVASRVNLDGYLVRDIAQDDREVLASLIISYLFSELTLGVIIVLVLLGLVSTTIRRRENPARKQDERRGM